MHETKNVHIAYSLRAQNCGLLSYVRIEALCLSLVILLNFFLMIKWYIKPVSTVTFPNIFLLHQLLAVTCIAINLISPDQF
jgi:hypothetical protein